MHRPPPTANAEWLLEIAMVATLVRTNFGSLNPDVLIFVVPRAPMPGSPAAKAAGAARRAKPSRSRKRREYGLEEFAAEYMRLHVRMGHLTAAEARLIADYVAENILTLTNIVLNLERTRPAPPRAAAPAGAWLQLKVTLAGVKPGVWRRLVVPAELKLPVLHTVLQEAMGWTDSHLHQFLLGNQRYAIPDEDDFSPPDGDERKLCLGDLVAAKGDVLTYEYDFGDGWEHELRVEKVLAEPPVDGRICCLAGANACPPEDVGGPHGYHRMRVALADPDDEEHDSYREWVGRSFDPKAFDIDEVNAALARIKSSTKLRVVAR